MKNIFTLLLLLGTLQAVGQNAAISLNPFKKATLSLHNGSTTEGFARFNLNNNLVFKSGEEAEKEILDDETVSRIVMFSDEGEKTIYDYKKVEGKFRNYIAMLELLEEGKVNLYHSKHTSVMPSAMGMGAGIPIQQTLYYLSGNAENTAILINNANTRSRKFRKISKDFFSDCASLMSKLNNKEFRRGEIKEVVEFYNTNCEEAGI